MRENETDIETMKRDMKMAIKRGEPHRMIREMGEEIKRCDPSININEIRRDAEK